jgi:hypothetical protein
MISVAIIVGATTATPALICSPKLLFEEEDPPPPVILEKLRAPLNMVRLEVMLTPIFVVPPVPPMQLLKFTEFCALSPFSINDELVFEKLTPW